MTDRDRNETNAQAIARLAFETRKDSASRRDALFFHQLDHMRNAWVAYHAGASWMATRCDLAEQLDALARAEQEASDG